MQRLLFFILFILHAGLGASAGPWLREQGTTFSAVSFSSTYYLNTTSQTYLEYGLREHTTLIADIAMARAPYALQSGSVTASLRRALSKPDASSKWAYELGLGVGWIGPYTLPHIRTALSWGKGITLMDKSGELLSSLVFEACRSCGDLAGFGSFNSVFERNACDDFGEVVKAA